MKKRLYVAGIVVVSVVAVALYLSGREGVAKNIAVGSLSNRAQEFLNSQRTSPESVWQNQQLEPVEALTDTRPSSLQQTPCFSIDVRLPIRTVYPRAEEACDMQIRLTSPAAKLTISSTPISGPLDENSAVHMRMVTTDVYKQEDFVSAHFPESLTFSDPQGISFFALREGKMLAVIFSETNDQEKILSESLPSILETLTVY